MRSFTPKTLRPKTIRTATLAAFSLPFRLLAPTPARVRQL